MPVMAMQHYSDPVEEIFDRIGDLSEFKVPRNLVLVGIYMRPSATKGGILLTDTYREEDKWQGIAGLVLKRGPLAFKSEDGRFEGFDPEPGTWITFRPSDGIKFDIRSKEGHCILVKDDLIQMMIPSPDLVF